MTDSDLSTKPPGQGSGGFTWSTGGWFGAQLGATAWMLIAAAILFVNSVGAGLLVLGFFLLPNIVGLWLWSARNRMRAYTALQILLALCGVFSFATLWILDENAYHIGSAEPGALVGGNTAPGNAKYLALLLFAGLMVMFHFIERAARRRNAPRDKNQPPQV